MERIGEDRKGKAGNPSSKRVDKLTTDKSIERKHMEKE
jgi:hypothetical protein